MSTSCVVTLQDSKIGALYCHWDGFPEAKIEWLSAFNKKFVEERGDDDPYKFAQLIRSSVFDAEKYNLDLSRSTGWGVISMDDVEEFLYCNYHYRLMKDGSVNIIKI